MLRLNLFTYRELIKWLHDRDIKPKTEERLDWCTKTACDVSMG